MRKAFAVLIAPCLVFTASSCLGKSASGSEAAEVTAQPAASSAETAAAAPVTDENGRIVECILDDAQNRMKTDAVESERTSGSRKELEYDCSMVKYPETVNEWFEQAAAFEKYPAGKTAGESAFLVPRVRGENELHRGNVVKTGETLFLSCFTQITSFGM